MKKPINSARRTTPQNKLAKKPSQKKQTDYKLERMQYFLSSHNQGAPEYLEHFADEQLEYYCNTPDAKYINQFYLLKGVHKAGYYEWLKKCPHLKKIHNLCLEIIGLRREQAMEKANALILKLRQYQYDPDFGVAEEREVELKSKADKNKQGDIIVNMPTNEKVIDRDKYKPHKKEDDS